MFVATLLDFAVCALALVLVRWIHNRRSRSNPANLPHPPGPPGLPLIGNLRDIPKQRGWLTYQRWSQQYGEVLGFLLEGHG